MTEARTFVAAMCDAIDEMALTPGKREFARTLMRFAIEYANARHPMLEDTNSVVGGSHE